jgi:hypothetical protein
MRAVIDRIEDGKIAVFAVKGGGDMYLPVKQLGFKIREGMWISIEMKPDETAGKASVARIKKLQNKLLGRAKK